MKSEWELKKFYNVDFGKTYKIFNSHGDDYFHLVGKTFRLERRFNEKHGNINIRAENLTTFALHILDDYDYKEIESCSLLTPKEKEYLSNVIKPFKDRVVSIHKFSSLNKGAEVIAIRIKMDSNLGNFLFDTIYLPFFKAGTMYKELVEGIQYTPAELGL